MEMGTSPASLEIKPSAHLVDPTSCKAGWPVPQCFRRSLAKKGRGWEAGQKQKAQGLLVSSSRGRLACPPPGTSRRAGVGAKGRPS